MPPACVNLDAEPPDGRPHHARARHRPPALPRHRAGRSAGAARRAVLLPVERQLEEASLDVGTGRHRPAGGARHRAALHRRARKPGLPPRDASLGGAGRGTGKLFRARSRHGTAHHVHVHYQLLTGGFWTTIYRLPFERALLRSTTHHNVFRTPAPDFELLVFAIRMVQRYRWRDALRGDPGWLKAIQGELDALLKEAQLHRLEDVMAQHLPTIDVAFVDECLASLRPGYSRWRRLGLRRELHQRLRAHSKQAPLSLKLWKTARSILTLQGRLGGGSGKKRLPARGDPQR